MADSGAGVLLIQERFNADRPKEFDGKVVQIDADWPAIAEESDTRISKQIDSNSSYLGPR